MLVSSLAFILAIVTTKPTTPPIAVESCVFVKSASYAKGVKIVFHNSAKVAAKLVIFDVSLRNYRTEVVDEGDFAPGQTVDHTFTSVPLTLWMGEKPTRCIVEHVHFADGTTWGD